MIYMLMQSGMSYTDAQSIPITEANQLLTCHWQSQGFQVQKMNRDEHGITPRIDREAKFDEISNRKKEWPLELP